MVKFSWAVVAHAAQRSAFRFAGRALFILFFGGDPMNQSNSEQLARLNQRLKKIKGNDPISRARKEALLKAIYELQQAEVV